MGNYFFWENNLSLAQKTFKRCIKKADINYKRMCEFMVSWNINWNFLMGSKMEEWVLKIKLQIHPILESLKFPI